MSVFRKFLGAFAICAFLTATDAEAQFSLSAGIGYATYAMSDLKDIHNELLTRESVDAHTISYFPPYITQDITMFYRLRRANFGAFLSFNSTGSRVSYKDYSGSLTYDQLVSSTHYGVFYGHNFIAEPGPWEVIGSIRMGYISTAYQINLSSTLNGGASSKETYDFVSTSQLISPGLALTRNFNHGFFASFDTRYLLNIQQNLVLKSDGKTYLFNKNNTPQAADWSGLRLTLSVGVRFGKSPGSE